MALVHVDGTGQITWVFNVNGTDGHAVMTLGFQTDNNDAQQVALKAADRLMGPMQPFFSAACQLIETKVLLRLSGNTESASDFTGTPMAGNGPAAMFPANVAILVQKRSAFAGRKNRGRMYMPGFPYSNATATGDPNTLQSATLTDCQSRWDTVFSGLKDTDDGDPINPVILHPAPTNTVTEITAFSVQARLATQRGRLRD